MWTVCNWLSSGLFWRFHRGWGISLLTEQLPASQEGSSSVELFNVLQCLVGQAPLDVQCHSIQPRILRLWFVLHTCKCTTCTCAWNGGSSHKGAGQHGRSLKRARITGLWWKYDDNWYHFVCLTCWHITNICFYFTASQETTSVHASDESWGSSSCVWGYCTSSIGNWSQEEARIFYKSNW